MVYLEDQNLGIATKKEVEKFRQPPKLKGKHFKNLEYLADASLNWLTPNNNKSFPCEFYNGSLNTSYFEQCFVARAKLGEGSFGSVIKVVSKMDRKNYAVKMSKEPFRSDKDRSQKLMEVRNHQQFSSHPNIVTLYEAWEEDRHLYLQMELCLFSLDSLEDPMTDEQCWNVLVDLTSALAVLHGQGIGHFDVKPANIQLGIDKKYKLGDFGLAYNFVSGAQNVPVEGDAKYLPPELLSTDNQFSAKADIFSLAITILELAGNLSLPSNGEVWQALRNGSLPKTNLTHISTELFSILKVMMLPNPDERPLAEEILKFPRVLAESRKDVNTRVIPLVVANVTGSSTASTSDPVFVSSTPFSERVSSSSSFAFPTPSPIQNETETSMSQFAQQPANRSHFFGVSSSSSFAFPTPSPIQNETETSMSQFAQQPANRSHFFVSGVASEIPVDEDQISFASPSTLKYGFSPVRLSDRLKEDFKAKKRRFSMTPRNLTNAFKDDDSSDED